MNKKEPSFGIKSSLHSSTNWSWDECKRVLDENSKRLTRNANENTKNKIAETTVKHSKPHSMQCFSMGGGLGTGHESMQSAQPHADASKFGETAFSEQTNIVVLTGIIWTVEL